MSSAVARIRSLKSAIGRSLMAVMRSPLVSPASQAGRPICKSPTTAGVTSTPERNASMKNISPVTTFIITPAEMMAIRGSTPLAVYERGSSAISSLLICDGSMSS